MRVIRWADVGILSGRTATVSNAFEPGAFTMDDGDAGEPDTRLPSERMGASKPLISIPITPRPAKLLLGAKV